MSEKAYWMEVTYKDPNTQSKKWRFVTEDLRKSAIKAIKRDSSVKSIKPYRAN